MEIASIREERCRVRVADVEEREAKAEAHLQEAEAELQRLRCWAQGAEADLRWAERDAEEDAEVIGCLELQVDGWTAQWAEVMQADEDWRRVMRRKEKQLRKAQKTIVYERAQTKMWKDRAEMFTDVRAKMFTERVRGEARRQRQAVMDVVAMEVTAMHRDYATVMKRVLGEAIEATRQEAQRVVEEVTQAGCEAADGGGGGEDGEHMQRDNGGVGGVGAKAARGGAT